MARPEKPIRRSDGKVFRSAGMAAAALIQRDGCGNEATMKSHIAAVARGERITAYGYRWEWVR